MSVKPTHTATPAKDKSTHLQLLSLYELTWGIPGAPQLMPTAIMGPVTTHHPIPDNKQSAVTVHRTLILQLFG